MSALEPGSDREGGNLGHRSTVSAAISAKRSADALERIEALLAAPSPPPDAGEVRTYREGVEDSARVCDAMHAAWREQESRYRAAGNDGPYLSAPSYHCAATAIRKLP